MFLDAGKQGALSITTINYTQADQDVRRVVDSLTGSFRDDFQNRSSSFIDLVNSHSPRRRAPLRMQPWNPRTVIALGSRYGHRADRQRRSSAAGAAPLEDAYHRREGRL